MSQPDRKVLLRALEAFLNAEPETWTSSAPEVVGRAGLDRLRAIVAATRERVGGIDWVTDSPDGLVISGPAGEVLAWARVDARGRLAGLWIAGALRGRPRSPGLAALIADLLPVLPIAWGVWGCWTADSVRGWAGAVLLLIAFVVLVEGFGGLAARPWWIRRPLEVLAVGGFASVIRVGSYHAAGQTFALVGGVVLLVAALAALVHARRHRWRVTTAEPLPVFPVTGRWYVVQGGGRLINHHAIVAEQRGAVDLVGVRAGRSYRGDPRRLESYIGYGDPVVAPCAGQVVAAVDDIEDQQPGFVRFAPPYGNHVSIDTGSEVVTVAHLRPGSVAVALGDRVEAGQFIGAVGNSGNSTAPHLHLQAERAGLGLDLRFADVPDGWYRGRTVSVPIPAGSGRD